MMDSYQVLDRMLAEVDTPTMGFGQMVANTPVTLDPLARSAYATQHDIITDFQRRTVSVFRAALGGELPAIITRLLLNDAPSCYDEGYHVALGDVHWEPPKFFRTDEAAPGHIVEIQCPGSLWGEAELLTRLYREHTSCLGLSGPTIAQQFTKSVLTILDGLPPTVHHMLDNSSGPSAMRYFIMCSRPYLKYYGFDVEVSSLDCSFVRSHSFFGLMGQNYAAPRLRAALEKRVIFDHPPNILFGQKAPLVLPFWTETAPFFDETIRRTLVYTTPVVDDGVVTASGDRLSLERFARQPRRLRDYFLKYGGCDVSRNWGSREVYYLGNIGREACLRILLHAAADSRRGGLWIMQPRVTRVETVSYMSREREPLEKKMTAKYSAFHGPTGIFGVVAQFRDFYKVHGQADTVMTCAV